LGPGDGLIGAIASQMEPLNIGDCRKYRRFKYTPPAGEEDLHSFLGVPIVFQGTLLGVLAVQRRQSRKFTEQEVSFVFTLAVQTASHIEFAKLTQRVIETPDDDSAGLWIDGVAAAPGVGIGSAVVLYQTTDLHTIPDRAVTDIDAERSALKNALTEVEKDFRELSTSQPGLTVQQHELMDAYSMLLTSKEFADVALARVDEDTWAPAAVRSTVDELAQRFETMEDPYLRERGRDIRDLGRRVIDKLLNVGGDAASYSPETILVGQDLGPVDLMSVPSDRLRGVISERGSALSHTAIVARALGIPAVMGLGNFPFMQVDGREIIVDGYRGRFCVSPSNAVRREYQRLAREERALTQFLETLEDRRAITPDGEHITVLVNAGLPGDLALSLKAGAEGIGLYRTEFLFMTRDRFPTEDQQVALYREVLEAFNPRPVTLRTLDIGGDKSLPYFPISEPNPFLGWRGIRVSLDHPEIFETQLRALLRASAGLSNVRLVLPMVSGVAELQEALSHLDKAYDKLVSEGCHLNRPPIGVMIEVPSAVYLADFFARYVDFFSIGTNDLTQYLLAVDRNNENVAKLFDPLNPAVLQAICHVIRCGERYQKPVTLCGEIATDPFVTLLLLSMGAKSLSVNAGDVPKVKWLVTKFNRTRGKELLDRALSTESSAIIRELLQTELEDAGLSSLVRPGN
jgi:phosphotransferase system enzyme I (PtsP)